VNTLAVSARERLVITFAAMAATLMQTLDSTITNVALPHMQGSLSAAPEQITWVLTSYIVASAIATAPTGALAQRIGRKRLFLTAITGFTVASMACGLAADLGQMVAFRLLQGLFGASLVPLSQLVLLEIYPREKHGPAMALWGMGVMVGPILGPSLGGWLTENFDWRWVFFVNLPAGALAFLGLSAALPASAPSRDARFDWLGFLLLSGAIGALQLALDRGQTLDWLGSPEIQIEFAVAALCLYLFVAQVLTARAPFLRPQLFADRNFTSALFMIFIVGIVLFSTAALMPQFLQRLKEFPVVTSGMVIAPRGVGTMLAMLVVGRLVARIDARLLMCGGMALIAATLGQTSTFNLDVPVATVAWNGFFQGVGLGLVFVPLNTLAYATLPAQERTDATALFSLVRNLGSSVGIALTFALLEHGTQSAHAALVQDVTPFNPAVSTYVANGAPYSTESLALIESEVTRQASLIAMLGDFRLMMFAVLAATPLLLIFRCNFAPGSAPPAAAALE
jgi:DHA2 family multidrug resistance protein